MSTVVPFKRAVPVCRYGFEASAAETELRDLISDGDRILPVQHAYQRMAERDVTFTQVLRILRRGALVEGPSLSEFSTWRFKYRGDSAGQDISVVVDLDRDSMGSMVAVITVIVH